MNEPPPSLDRANVIKTPAEAGIEEDDGPPVVVVESPPVHEAVEAARALVNKPEGAVDRVLREIPGASPEAVVEAVGLAKAKGKGWPYAIGILKNWGVEGRAIVPPPAIAPTPACRLELRPFVPPPSTTAQERDEAQEWGRRFLERSRGRRGGCHDLTD